MNCWRPVAVHEIIKGNDELDETARYTLDVMIAEFKPDTALICIALCAAHIAEMHSGYLPIAGSLGFEAGRIVHEFGPTWLANADRRLTAAHERHVMDLLDQMPEDFEAMADLLDATRAHLIETQIPPSSAKSSARTPAPSWTISRNNQSRPSASRTISTCSIWKSTATSITFPKHYKAH